MADSDTTVLALGKDYFPSLNKSLEGESDRAVILIVAECISNLLEIKLKNEFRHGNSESQKKLFGATGPFATFSARISVAYCAGWIDRDIYHDIEVIRGIRNRVAHNIDKLDFDTEDIRKKIESLIVPYRKYHDWGQVKVASTDSGFVFYTGERPDNAKEDLHMPAKFTFQQAMEVIIFVLIAKLEIPVAIDETNGVILTLPSYMEEAKSMT